MQTAVNDANQEAESEDDLLRDLDVLEVSALDEVSNAQTWVCVANACLRTVQHRLCTCRAIWVCSG